MNEAILLGSDTLGSGDEALGRILVCNFLRNLADRETPPNYIVLWNAGVKTATRDASTLEYLKKLEERGVKIVLCRTCVEYFGIEKDIAAGKIDGMVGILEILSTHQVLTV